MSASHSTEGDQRRRRPASAMSRLAAALALLALQPQGALTLTHAQLEVRSLLATDNAGGVAAFEPGRQRLSLWINGKLQQTCQVPIAGVSRLAIGAGQALFVTGAGETDVVLRVVDIATCQEAARHDWRGEPIVYAASGYRQWLLATGRYRTPSRVHSLGMKLEPLRESASFEPPTTSANPGAKRLVVLATSDQTVWLLPAAKFSLFAWKKDSRQWDTMAVPHCLESSGFDLIGEENLVWLRRLLEEADAQSRPFIEAMIGQASTGAGGGGYVSALTAAAAYDDTLGVLVRSDRGRRCTLQLLRPASAKRAAVILPGPCPSFVALGRDVAWLQTSSGFSEVPLPKTFQPIASACR